jgi:SAM-dependent methyltransferase
MSQFFIDPKFGRVAFGDDPGGYHVTRPGYPEWVFEILCERCRLAHGTATFEIGAGTGTATRRLLELGASPLLAIEPDSRLATFLRETIRDKALSVSVSAFEDAALEKASFDLGVSATAFHWLDEDMALMKVAELLRPGGWWAMVWNVFGDNSRPDPFHDATKALLDGPSSPSAAHVVFRSPSTPMPAWRRWSVPARSMPSSFRQAPGRSSSILTKSSRSMRLFPISTFAPIARQSSRN